MDRVPITKMAFDAKGQHLLFGYSDSALKLRNILGEFELG